MLLCFLLVVVLNLRATIDYRAVYLHCGALIAMIFNQNKFPLIGLIYLHMIQTLILKDYISCALSIV